MGLHEILLNAFISTSMSFGNEITFRYGLFFRTSSHAGSWLFVLMRECENVWDRAPSESSVKPRRSGGLPVSRWIRWVSKNIDVQMERKRFWPVDVSLQTERSRTSAWDWDAKLIGGEETLSAVTKVPPTGCSRMTHTSRLFLVLSYSLIFGKLLLARASWREVAWEGVLGFV